jgi:ribosomal 50S subunit-associated protein YjgA (DUF615 family)
MNCSKNIRFVSMAVFLIAAFSGSSFSQVFHHPSPTDNLISRWDWAKQEAVKKNAKKGFWIGYSIKRLMEEHRYIYSTDKHTISGTHFTDFARGDSLEKILSGKVTYSLLSGEEQIKLEAKRVLADLESKKQPEKKVWKDLAVLFKFGPDSSQVPLTILASNLYLPFDPEGLPIFWLDHSEDASSLSILDDVYARSNQEKLKKRALTIAGLHGTSNEAVAFLEKILESRDPDPLRARAAMELGDQDHERAVELLHRTAKDDRSFEVRKGAVYGLEDIELPGAADALIDIAQNSKDREIRKRAIDCLADIASKKTAEALKGVVDKDEDTDIQKRAVYALEDLPDNEGIPYLIDIAKTHSKISIRKAAIYCLGDSDDPRALQALIQIIRSER